MSVSGPPPPHDPYNDIRVHPAEKDAEKKEEEEQKEQEDAASPVLFAHFLRGLSKLLRFFTQNGEGFQSEHTITEHSLEDDLKRLLSAFDKLKVEDYSQDVSTLNQLSSWWHQFLEDAERSRGKSAYFSKLENFIEHLHAYPESEKHSLGYYLLEYAGAEWIPFPFMDLLQDLHLEHQKTPATSHLTKWTTLLRQLISQISRDL